MSTKLKNLLLRTWAAKQTKEEVEREHKSLQAETIDLFHAEKTDKLVVEDGGRIITGTMVEGTTTVLDEEALRDLLTDAQWDAITIPAVDKGLLEAHILTGQIDADAVERCVEIRPRSPFLRFTVKEGAAPAAPVKKARGGQKAKAKR